MAALRNRAGHYIFVLGFFFLFFFFLFSSSVLSGRRLDVYHTSTRDVALVSANLARMSEMCCTRLAENTGRKKTPKIRHLGTIVQFCRAVSSQRRYVSTIEKKLVKQQ